jgi:hypothetical protein
MYSTWAYLSFLVDTCQKYRELRLRGEFYVIATIDEVLQIYKIKGGKGYGKGQRYLDGRGQCEDYSPEVWRFSRWYGHT